MADNTDNTTTGWTVGRSMPLELDAALSAINRYFPTDNLPPEIGAFLRQLPPDWEAQRETFLGPLGRTISLLSNTACFADVLLTDDYERSTSAIRELTIDQALENYAPVARRVGIVGDGDLPPDERLIDLTLRVIRAAHHAIGLARSPEIERVQAQELRQALRILRDGDLHTRFWHWLDRFYYESYRPWRATRVEFVDRLITHATLALGDQAKVGVAPETAWLPPQNPLLRFPELHDAVHAGRLHVFFWAEPFGLTDLWLLQPGMVAVSFAAPGPLYQNFKAFAEDVATRVKALSDPTRLTILRIIRHFGMINTEMADYLELARPTVSIHAKILREAGLIRSYQDGRAVRHELVPEEVRRLIRDLERFLDLPDEQA